MKVIQHKDRRRFIPEPLYYTLDILTPNFDQHVTTTMQTFKKHIHMILRLTHTEPLIFVDHFRRAMLRKCMGPMSSCGVCVSVTFVNSVKTNSTFLSPSGSQAILVFPYQTVWQYSDGNPPNRGVEYMWGRQKSRF